LARSRHNAATDSRDAPRACAADTAKAHSAASWPVKALVEATPISGPVWMATDQDAMRSIDDPALLRMARPVRPASKAARKADKVSAVSPDWLTARDTVRVGSPSNRRCLVSEATSTPIGKDAQSSNQ